MGAGAGIGAIVLLAWMVGMFSGREGSSESMRYLPNDCTIVAMTNFDELMSSSVYQQMKKDLPNFEAGERNMEQEMGISPANVSRITFAAGGKLNSANGSNAVMVIRLKKAVSAADIKSKSNVKAGQKDFKYEEVKVGGITVFEETYRPGFGGEKAERVHGGVFCMPEGTLIVACPKLEVLKKILERGKSPQFSEAMQNAMRETDFSRTVAVAVNVKGLEGSPHLAGLPNMAALNGLTENVVGLAADISLNSSTATVGATLLCKDAKLAEDVKKMLDATQVAARNYLKKAPGVPSDVADMVDAIKLTLSGAKIKGNMQISLEPLSKWTKEQTGKK